MPASRFCTAWIVMKQRAYLIRLMKLVKQEVLIFFLLFMRQVFLRRPFTMDKMRGHETGIWRGFYKNDCEADIRQSAILMEGLMSYLRVLGDGPHFYRWQRKFQSGAGGDRIHLILRLKEHLTDMELWNLMSH